MAAIVNGEHANPHAFLGHHGGIVRVWRPGASAVFVGRNKAEVIDQAGLFEARDQRRPRRVQGRASTIRTATTIRIDDPYRFWPTLGDLDLHLIGEGRHERLWEVLGAHHRDARGHAGHGVRGVGAVGARGAGGR